MKIKLHILKYAAAACLISMPLAQSSCSLDESPSSFINSGQFYQTREQCVAGLNSCYIPLKTIYTYTYMIATEGVTDLMCIASGTLDSQLDISPALPRFGANMWTDGYKGVMYCNAAIEGIRRSPLADEVKNPLLAEGVVMRAYYYWFLTSTFGNVPFYTIDVATDEIRREIAAMSRMSAVDTRNYLIDELRKYTPLMNQVRSSDIADNHCGAAMGWMLMAKLAQWNRQWDTALEALGELEKIYGSDLSVYSLDDIRWRKKNTAESIFEIQHTYTQGGLAVTSNCASICTPLRSSANDGYTYDGVVIKELGNTATTWTPLRPNPYFYQALQTRKGGDKRVKFNLAWEYDGHLFNSVSTTPWLGPKFWCLNMSNTADYNNQVVFRYADAVLMQAECHAELDRSTEAMHYLNKVKARAGIELYEVFKNKDHLIEEIRRERGRELLGEFQRKYDLVRWGIWFQSTYDYTNYSTLKNNMKPCHEYYPIPDTEVAASGYALDNKEYAKYGM